MADNEERQKAGFLKTKKKKSKLPPAAKKLKVDCDLKLSFKQCDLKQSIKQILLETKETTKKSESKSVEKISPFPSPGLLANFSILAYQDYLDNETDEQYEERLALPDGWKLLTTACNLKFTNGYFGAAYWHPTRHQLVIAHRGTKPKKLNVVCLTDGVGILYNNDVPQMNSASTFADIIRGVLTEIQKELGIHFDLFITGHSLGGWLSQITTFTTEYLETVEDKSFQRTKNSENRRHAHTVVFDSPGCKEMLEGMKDKFDARIGGSINLNSLDITSYLSAPNRVNTCNSHIGTVYRIFVKMSDAPLDDIERGGLLSTLTCCYDIFQSQMRAVYYTKKSHSKEGIRNVFDKKTGQVCRDESDNLKIQTVVDWPICTGLRRSEEYTRFFEFAKQFNDYNPEPVSDSSEPMKLKRRFNCCFFSCIRAEGEERKGYRTLRYETKKFDPKITRLNIFTESEKKFVKNYHSFQHYFNSSKTIETDTITKFKQLMQGLSVDDNEDTICSTTTPEALHEIIPLVKGIVRTLVDREGRIISIEHAIYDVASDHYLQIKQLDFKDDSSRLEHFLGSNFLKIWELKSPGETPSWIKLKQVYRAFQTWKDSSPDNKNWCCHIMELNMLLDLNDKLELKKILCDSEDPHLLMLDCSDTCGEKLPSEIFSMLENNSRFKIITAMENNKKLSDYFPMELSQLVHENIILRSECQNITWMDIKPESKKQLLERHVKFQGNIISLSELIDVDDNEFLEKISPVMLIDENVLEIGKGISKTAAYDEFYYIPRTFQLQTIVKQNIIQDTKNNTKFPDILAYSEEEFINLCQKNPTKIVHQLNKNDLTWQNSNGSLSRLRPYIDTTKYQEIGEDMIQSSEKVVIISDSPGMGKTTFIDRLSTLEKQKCPDCWVVRLYLKDYTKQFKDIKEKSESFFRTEPIDTAIKFLSKDLLNISKQLEKDIFEHVITKTGKMCIFFDGYDEISPYYSEIVLSLVQKLRETAVNRIWITTRPHMRETLEDGLQEFSHILKAFSEEDQINFLAKNWQHGFGIRDEKRTKLNNYSKSLIEKVLESIKDEGQKFTGIPLQTRMLAEIYGDRAVKFCNNAELTPELPERFSLIQLYEQFIGKKIEIYGEKLNLAAGNIGLSKVFKREQERLVEEHKLFSLTKLFMKDQIEMFHQIHRKNSVDEEELPRIGIIQKVFNNFEFIHRTFAEYFAAHFFLSQLFQERKPLKEECEFLWKVVLVENKYEILALFLDSLLSKHSVPEQTKREHEKFFKELCSECKMSPQGDTALHVSYRHGLLSIVELLLSSLKDDDEYKETFKNILTSKNCTGSTPLHCAISNKNFDSLKELLDLITNNWGNEFSTKLLLEKDGQGRNILHLAINNNKETGGGGLWTNYVYKLIDYVRNNYDLEILREMIKENDEDGTNVVQYAMHFNNLESAIGILEYIKVHFDQDTLRETVFEKDNDGGNAVHYAVGSDNLDAAMGFLEYVQTNFDLDSSKRMVIEKGFGGRNAIYYAMFNQNWKHLAEILENSDDNLNLETVKNIVVESNDSKLKTLFKFLDYCIDHFGVPGLEDLLFFKNNNYYLSLNLAVLNGFRKTMKFLIENGADVFAENCHDSVLHLAVQGNDTEIVTLVLEAMKAQGESKLSQGINRQDGEGDPPIQWAIADGQIDIFRLLLKYGIDLSVKNKQGVTALACAVQMENFEFAVELVKYGANVQDLNNEQYTQFLNSEALKKSPEIEQSLLPRTIVK